MPIQDNELVIDINYNPLPKQIEFHQSIAKYRLYIGAWRAGKTLAGCQEGYKHSYLYPKNCGIIFRKDFTDLRDTTMKTMLEVIPSEDIKDFNKSEHRILLQNGSEIYFRHLKDGLKLGSLNLGWFFVDEASEIQEEIFEALKGRLSLKNSACKGWLCSNPPNTDHWLYKTFYNNKDIDYQVFHASTYENEKNLPETYIPDLEKMPESWKKKYLMGEWGFTPEGTPFYQGFKESIHTKDLSDYKPQRIYRIWDYGFHHPACLLLAIDDKGRVLTLKETMGSDVTIQQFGEYIKQRCREWYPSTTEWIDYGDPAGMQKTDKSEKTSVEILASIGIFVSSKQSTFRERKEIIERKLATLIEGIPSLIIDISCKILIDGLLGGYHYPARKHNQGYNPAVYEVPTKDGFYEHICNCLEYFMVNTFTGAESKEDKTESTYRIVGDMKDIHWEEDEEDRYSENYRQAIRR